MHEAGETRVSLVLVSLVAGWMMSEPQPLLAQRTGAQPYPPPKSVEFPTRNPRATGTPKDALESSRRDQAVEIAETLRRRQLAAELAEDFKRLGQINREKLLPLSSAESFDYRKVSEAVGEVNKRAKRIRSNTPLPLKEKKNQKGRYATDAAHLGSMLPELSRLIDSFLGSPVFRVTSINDDDLRSAAGSDLERIIRLSDAINRIAKQLARSSPGSA